MNDFRMFPRPPLMESIQLCAGMGGWYKYGDHRQSNVAMSDVVEI